MQPPDSRQSAAGRWVSFDRARMMLGMSEGTLRRAIRDGKVIAEQRRRSPDSLTDTRMIYEVWIPDPPVDATPIESDTRQTPAAEPPADTAWLQAKLDERDAIIREKDATISQQAERIADLAARASRAEAEAEVRAEALEWTEARRLEAVAEATRLAAELERERRRSWWQRLWG